MLHPDSPDSYRGETNREPRIKFFKGTDAYQMSSRPLIVEEAGGVQNKKQRI